MSYVTNDIFFAASLLYVFTFDSLLRIEFNDDPKATTQFHIDAPVEDCHIYAEEFQRGELAITDLMSYVKSYTRLVSILKKMRRDGEVSWCSASWIRGRG